MPCERPFEAVASRHAPVTADCSSPGEGLVPATELLEVVLGMGRAVCS